jgi:hypothetical protein
MALFEGQPGIDIRGFNVRPGVAFIRDENIWIATTKVIVDVDNEVVHVIARDGIEREHDENVKPHSFTFDFNDRVRLVGIVMHPNDEDDCDLGVFWDAQPPVDNTGWGMTTV